MGILRLISNQDQNRSSEVNMKLSSSPTDSSVPSSRNKAGKHGQRSVLIPGILVNQDLGKIKLDEDVPASVKMETNSLTNQPRSEVKAGGTFTEEFTVTKEEEDVSFQSSEDSDQRQESQMTSCSCREEIESLKNTVKQLTSQVEKQNQMIGGIKSSLRNAVLSLMACCQDVNDEESLLRDEGHNVQESPVIVNAFSKAFTPQAEDPLLIEIGNSGVQISGASVCQLSVTPEASSNEAGFLHGQILGDQEDSTMDDEDDKVDAEIDDNDDDSSYVPDDDDDTEDIHHGLQGNQLKLAKHVTKANRECIRIRSTTKTKSTAKKSEGSFGCSKCGRKYMSKKSLDFHTRSLHSKNRPLFKCHLCPKAFSYRGILANHISSIHDRLEHKCAYCPGKFNDKSSLMRHQKSVHMKGGPPTQQCDICGIHLVMSELSLGAHMAKVHKRARTKPLSRKKETRQTISIKKNPV